MRTPHAGSPRATSPVLLMKLLLATPVLVLLAGGCSFSVGTADEVSAEDLAAKVDETLQANKGEQSSVSDVACDGPMATEVDAEQLCHFTDALDDRYAVAVTVTAVDGSDLKFHLQVDDGQTVEPDELEPELVTQLTQLSGGTAPDAVDCPDDLRGLVDATTTCVLTASEDRLEVTVTVTSAQGPDVAFDIEVGDQPLDDSTGESTGGPSGDPS